MPAEDQPIPSVWARPKRSPREQPALSRDQIVAAAIRLLDTEGVDSLSMRKLGTKLNAGATSLYTHVANKDELLELVVDQAFGEVVVPTQGEDWRAAATEVAVSMRSVIMKHPWLATMIGGVGLVYFGPNMVRLSENMLGMFETGGFPLELAHRAMNVVVAFVIGAATTDAAMLSLLVRSGQDEREWLARLRPASDRAVQGFPRLTRLDELHAAKGDDSPLIDEEFFLGGLEWVLDGIATHLPR